MDWQQPFSHYLVSASPVVQIVLLLLIIASVFSWTVIFQRWFTLSRAERSNRRFQKWLLKHDSFDDLLAFIEKKPKKAEGLAVIFREGYKEWQRVKNLNFPEKDKLNNVLRLMRVQTSYEEESLEANLSLLATVGSVSPYVGLFGTVWGIMMSFHALGGAQQVTIAMVAPGISEALVATALGLFAAIPAVIFYNRYISMADKIINRFMIFQEEFLSRLQREEADHDTSQA